MLELNIVILFTFFGDVAILLLDLKFKTDTINKVILNKRTIMEIISLKMLLYLLFNQNQSSIRISKVNLKFNFSSY